VFFRPTQAATIRDHDRRAARPIPSWRETIHGGPNETTHGGRRVSGLAGQACRIVSRSGDTPRIVPPNVEEQPAAR